MMSACKQQHPQMLQAIIMARQHAVGLKERLALPQSATSRRISLRISTIGTVMHAGMRSISNTRQSCGVAAVRGCANNVS